MHSLPVIEIGQVVMDKKRTFKIYQIGTTSP